MRVLPILLNDYINPDINLTQGILLTRPKMNIKCKFSEVHSSALDSGNYREGNWNQFFEVGASFCSEHINETE